MTECKFCHGKGVSEISDPCICRYSDDIERLSTLCDKWNSECDEYREENKRQDERIRALESEVRVKDLTIGQMANTTQALEAHNAVLREALVVTHDLYAHASSGYGFARPDNPHNFSPDFECCSQEEIAAHSKACEDYDAGRKISNESWGIGAYCDEYAPALKALASTPESALSSIRRAERERCAKVCDERRAVHMTKGWPAYEKEAGDCAAAIRQMED